MTELSRTAYSQAFLKEEDPVKSLEQDFATLTHDTIFESITSLDEGETGFIDLNQDGSFTSDEPLVHHNIDGSGQLKYDHYVINYSRNGSAFGEERTPLTTTSGENAGYANRPLTSSEIANIEQPLLDYKVLPIE